MTYTPTGRRRGRAPHPDGPTMPARLQIPCTRALRDQILDTCQREGLTVAALLRGLAERWLADHQVYP